MAYRRKQGVARGSTFREEILNPSPNLNERSPASSLAAKAIRASSAHRDSSLSSAYGYGYGHSPQPTSTSPIPSSPSSSTSTSTSASTSTKDSTGYEYTSMKSLGEPKQGFWGVLARKAKAIIDDDNVPPQCESPRRTGLQMPDTARKGRYYDPYQSPESRSKTDSPPLQKGLGAIASSLNYIGGTIGNALEEGLTIVENRTADIIQETRKLQVRKKGSRSEARNQASTVSDTQQQPPLQQHPLQTHIQPSTQTDLEIQLKASRDVAMAMAAKAKLLLRELKTVKADLAFAKERCAQLEEENRILRESRDKGDNLEDDDLIRLQLETLLAEKARLAQENSVFARENRFLREIVEYHQLTMQDVVYLDEGSEEVTEVYPIKVPPTVTNLPSLTTNPSLVPHSLSPLSPNPQVTHNRSPLHIPSSEPVELSQTIIPTSPYIHIPVVEEHQERH